ncbi:hypothetical protein ACF0H5_010078 [Mactra antiquata]
MKAFITLFCLGIFVYVNGEPCQNISDCKHTICDVNHGWFLHCINQNCGCNHDTYTGSACPSGQSSDCIAAHGNRCNNVGGTFHCLDSVCHCVRNNIDIGK